jgi:hypothetical protein
MSIPQYQLMYLQKYYATFSSFYFTNTFKIKTLYLFSL